TRFTIHRGSPNHAPPYHDQTRHSRGAPPERASGMESNGRGLESLSRCESGGLLCRRSGGKSPRNSDDNLIRKQICMDWHGPGGPGIPESGHWNEAARKDDRASRSTKNAHDEAGRYSARQTALRKAWIHNRIRG